MAWVHDHGTCAGNPISASRAPAGNIKQASLGARTNEKVSYKINFIAGFS
jgi:hypothetical protein